MKKIPDQENELLLSIVSLIETARQRVALAVNSELTLLYWNIGKQINEEFFLAGRAEYGAKVVEQLSSELTYRFGSGFNKRNLQSFIKFHSVIQDTEILHSLRAKLSWTHIRQLIYIEDELKNKC